MTKPWEKFDKTKSEESESLNFTSDDIAEEPEVEGVLSFDMGAENGEEEGSLDDFDLDVDTAADGPFEDIENETAATVIFKKDLKSLDELSSTSTEELEKTINKIVGLDADDGIDLSVPEDHSTKIKDSTEATDNELGFSIGENDDEGEDAATRVVNLGTKGLPQRPSFENDAVPMEEDLDEEIMFADGDDEDAATRIFQVNKNKLTPTSDKNYSDEINPDHNSNTVGFEIQEDKAVEIDKPSTKTRIDTLSSDELIRLQATIRQLRAERGELLGKISDFKATNKSLESENLGYKAELDELKIELQIFKKRKNNEYEDIIYQNEVSSEKRAILESKNKNLQKEFDRLNQKVRVDFNQIQQREKELESQLELVSMDSESQVRSRDMKILELKRHIDQLEFNMENASIKEQKSREDKVKLEDKLANAIKSLRRAMSMLENDVDIDESLVQKIKKL
ncbi:MAG: hypothetical protein HN576_11040 [Bacteriovoracaceae bacterium]|jgi:hypothetical protein|nr:hypothetical protein [Bacteriovoracaceae bacterium]